MISIGPYINLYEVKDAADHANVTINVFRNMYESWGLEPIRIAGRIFFTKESLDALQARRAAKAAQHARCERAA